AEILCEQGRESMPPGSNSHWTNLGAMLSRPRQRKAEILCEQGRESMPPGSNSHWTNLGAMLSRPRQRKAEILCEQGRESMPPQSRYQNTSADLLSYTNGVSVAARATLSMAMAATAAP